MARRAASLLLVLASAASQYSAEQQQEFEKTREALLARDPLETKVAAADAGAAAVCEDAELEVIEAAPDGGYAAVLGQVSGLDTRFFSDEEIHRVHELPHWKDLDNLHHKVSYHLSTKLVARKPPSN